MSWLSSSFKKATGVSLTTAAAAAGAAVVGGPQLAAGVGTTVAGLQAASAATPAPAPAAPITYYAPAQGQANVSSVDQFPHASPAEYGAKSQATSTPFAMSSSSLLYLALGAILFFFLLKR